MKCNRIFSITLTLVMFGFLAVNSVYAGWTVTQLTDNNYTDMAPQIDGSNVVWEGWDGSDYEIFLATPEPATVLLLGLGAAMLGRKRRNLFWGM